MTEDQKRYLALVKERASPHPHFEVIGYESPLGWRVAVIDQRWRGDDILGFEINESMLRDDVWKLLFDACLKTCDAQHA